MRTAVDLPDTIPVFPLPGALLLPRAHLPLHIFEPRYLQMLTDALKTDSRIIGMVQPNPVPGRSENTLHTIGCAGRVTQFSRFRVVEEIEGFTPYRRCKASWAGFDRDLGDSETDETLDRGPFLSLLGRYFDARDLSADWDTLKEADDELLVNSLSMMLDFQPEDKQALLEAPSLDTRRETLVTLIEYALRGGGEGEFLQ